MIPERRLRITPSSYLKSVLLTGGIRAVSPVGHWRLFAIAPASGV